MESYFSLPSLLDEWFTEMDLEQQVTEPIQVQTINTQEIAADHLAFEIDALILIRYQFVIQLTRNILEGRHSVSAIEACEKVVAAVEANLVAATAPSKSNLVPIPIQDPIKMAPRYQKCVVQRGTIEDTFFKKPLYDHMMNNGDIMDLLAFGTDEQVENIPHFLCQGPTVSFTCNMAQECKLAVDVTLDLLAKNPSITKAELYRFVAPLADRACVGCKKNEFQGQLCSGQFSVCKLPK
jgi:hypothetical protein